MSTHVTTNATMAVVVLLYLVWTLLREMTFYVQLFVIFLRYKSNVMFPPVWLGKYYFFAFNLSFCIFHHLHFINKSFKHFFFKQLFCTFTVVHLLYWKGNDLLPCYYYRFLLADFFVVLLTIDQQQGAAAAAAGSRSVCYHFSSFHQNFLDHLGSFTAKRFHLFKNLQWVWQSFNRFIILDWNQAVLVICAVCLKKLTCWAVVRSGEICQIHWTST